MIEHAGSIVENETVDLADTDNDLERVSQRMRSCDKGCDNEAERSPCELCAPILSALLSYCKERPRVIGTQTAVTVSMHSTNGSEVKYRESERAYSFHNCPNKS